MSQAVETPATADAQKGRGASEADGGAGHEPASAILFSELVLAHFRWFAMHARYGELGGVPGALAPPGWPPRRQPTDDEKLRAEADYRAKLAQFEDAEGEIVGAHWSATIPSGLVLTLRRREGPFGRWRDPELRVHRATTWLTQSAPRVAELLHHCDTLGNKVAQLLRRTPKRVAMNWIFSTESYLLGIVEHRVHGGGAGGANGARGAPGEADTDSPPEGEEGRAAKANGRRRERARTAPDPERALVARARTELVEIEKYYDRAASNSARFMYFWGMLVGVAAAAVAGVLVALVVGSLFGVVDPSDDETRFFFACYTAGALGAVVSVLTRMRQAAFALDYEIGRMPAFWLGAVRPFLGAVFGLIVYFALRSELIQLETPSGGKAFFFFTLIAFAAGFSERLTKVILGHAERTVATTLDEADKAVVAAGGGAEAGDRAPAARR